MLCFSFFHLVGFLFSCLIVHLRKGTQLVPKRHGEKEKERPNRQKYFFSPVSIVFVVGKNFVSLNDGARFYLGIHVVELFLLLRAHNLPIVLPRFSISIKMRRLTRHGSGRQ